MAGEFWLDAGNGQWAVNAPLLPSNPTLVEPTIAG